MGSQKCKHLHTNDNLFHFLCQQNARERTTSFSLRTLSIVYAIVYCKHDTWSYDGSNKLPKFLGGMVLLLRERFVEDL